jgi:branched-chain amino acid transport system ATP-binding protein
MPLLQVRNMSHDFGGLRAVQNYSLELDARADPGAHRAQRRGKDDDLQLITGVYTPTEGEHPARRETDQRDPRPPIASMGLSRTFQNLLLWRHMTVLDT